jgi:RNA polymerase sigma-70 factor (ECF subfamily)
VTPEARFTAVFEQHHRDVERYLRRRAPDDTVADLIAEVFLVAWRRWDCVPQDNPLPWLYAAARNVLANEIRGRMRGRRLTERVAANTPPAIDGDHADDVSARLAVAAAFECLAPDDQEVLRLVAWERLGHADAAKVLGCGTAAFAMRLARARRRLRLALAQVRDPIHDHPPAHLGLPATSTQPEARR